MSEALPTGAVVGREIPVFRDVHHAAAFWLEHRAPKERSLSDPSRFDGVHGRSTSPLDYEAALRAIAAGLAGIHVEWHAPVLVHLGWRVGVKRLQSGEYQRRAGLTTGLPAGLTWRGLQFRCEQFRRALAASGVVDAGDLAAWDAVERGGYEMAEAKMGTELGTEKPLTGWKAIADHLGVSERTAKGWEELGMPVRRRGGAVIAFASRINEWLDGGREGGVAA